MKDVVYLNFAQLAYFDWHKLESKDIKKVKGSVDSLIDRDETWAKILPTGLIDSHEVEEINGIKMYQAADKRLFMKYSEEKPDEYGKRKPKYEKELSGWEFLYSADHDKIYKNYLGKEEVNTSSGFNGSAFKKGNNIIIAYRGTEGLVSQDMMNNLVIAFLKMSHPHLTATVSFYEHIKKEYGEGCNIHITGHSLGGALAQYACVYSGGIHKTRTFNALGIGIHQRHLGLLDMSRHFSNLSIANFNQLYSEEKTSQNIENQARTGFYPVVRREYGSWVISFGFMDINKTNIYKASQNNHFIQYPTVKLPDEQIKVIREQAKKYVENYRLLREQVDGFKKGLETKFMNEKKELIPNEILINYYNKLDLISLVQTRIGTIVNVYEKEGKKSKTDGLYLIRHKLKTVLEEAKSRLIKPEEKEKIEEMEVRLKELEEKQKNKTDVIDDSLFRLITSINLITGSGYHSVNDYILFLDEKNNIKQGEIGISFLKNMVKTAVLPWARGNITKWQKISDDSPDSLPSKIEITIKAEILEHLKKLEGNGSSNKFNKLKKTQWEKMKKLDVVEVKEIEENGEEKYVISLGQFNNLKEIRGIKGGYNGIIE